jgi:hypothetical protein
VSFSFLNNFILDDTELVIVEDNEYFIDISLGETNYLINCKPTHPDVNVSLIHGYQYTARGENWLEPKVRKIQNLFGKLMKINLYWVPISERFAGRSEFKLVFRKKEWTKTQESED